MYSVLFLSMIIVAIRTATVKTDNRRPIYSIGHMVNSIPEVRKYLSMGANVLESDVKFHEDGTVDMINHGYPCDCGRFCDAAVKLQDYLDHVREVADPETAGNYHDQLIMQFFDMKLDNVKDMEKAGSEIADAVLDHLWADVTDDNRVKVLLFIYQVDQNRTFIGFVDRFKKRGVQNLLKHVAFDGGIGSIRGAREMFSKLNITSGIWMGDGSTNCFSFVYPDSRLRNLLRFRDTRRGFIDKVYHWTIDVSFRIRRDLDLGVDGFITNRPDRVSQILAEDNYSSRMRLATPRDDPFTKFPTTFN